VLDNVHDRRLLRLTTEFKCLYFFVLINKIEQHDQRECKPHRLSADGLQFFVSTSAIINEFFQSGTFTIAESGKIDVLNLKYWHRHQNYLPERDKRKGSFS
jgi:hypothetical protein